MYLCLCCGDKVVIVHTFAGGNPLAVIKKQLGLKMSKIKRRCPLYFTTGEGTLPCGACAISPSMYLTPLPGEMVQKDIDKTVELEFNRLLDSVSYLSHHLQVNQLGGKSLSLGQALELVIQ